MQGSRAVAALRRPEYTGENRCLPCTVVNLGLVAAGGIAVAVWSSLAGALALATVGVALVYVRGYVVPGTPTLTERFLPDAVLAYFEHDGPSRTPNSDRRSIVPRRTSSASLLPHRCG